jgi:kynurenine formamidase
MRKTNPWIVVASALALSLVVSAQGAPPRVVDLGHPLRVDDPSWDGKQVYQRTPIGTIDKDGYTGGRFTVEEHFGTHVDAPAHFAAGGWTVDRIPPDRLYRPGVRIDVSKQASANADYQLTVADIKTFETQHGAIPEGAIVLVATGWDRFWPDRARYMNEKNGVKHFPGLTADASAYLSRDRRAVAIGIDTPSIDHGPSTKFEAHHASSALNVYHIENAAGLTKLPASGFFVLVAPVNIVGGSGGPTRIFAMLK